MLCLLVISVCYSLEASRDRRSVQRQRNTPASSCLTPDLATTQWHGLSSDPARRDYGVAVCASGHTGNAHWEPRRACTAAKSTTDCFITGESPA